jgi:hypothetical protein
MDKASRTVVNFQVNGRPREKAGAIVLTKKGVSTFIVKSQYGLLFALRQACVKDTIKIAKGATVKWPRRRRTFPASKMVIDGTLDCRGCVVSYPYPRYGISRNGVMRSDPHG